MEALTAIVTVKTNVGLSCEAFSEALAANPGVLKKIHSSENYYNLP